MRMRRRRRMRSRSRRRRESNRLIAGKLSETSELVRTAWNSFINSSPSSSLVIISHHSLVVSFARWWERDIDDV